MNTYPRNDDDYQLCHFLNIRNLRYEKEKQTNADMKLESLHMDRYMPKSYNKIII